jgi:hypothetical protein
MLIFYFEEDDKSFPKRYSDYILDAWLSTMLKIDYDYNYVIDWKSIAFSIKLKNLD